MMAKYDLEGFSEEVSQILPLIIRGVIKQQGDVWGLSKITMPQYICLDLIDHHQRLKMKDIASELNVSLPAATGLVNRLFSLGYVKRLSDKNDRRIIHITLTPKAKKIVSHVRTHRKEAFQKTFATLSSLEREQYLNILKKIKSSLYPEKI
jgi:DNA-binding MarR family transcriptional regulator